MPYRLTKIYTRKGDDGYTNLGDHRLSKDDLLVDAVGTIDELNSTIGFVIAQNIKDKSLEKKLMAIQNDLFDLGGELHLPQHAAMTAQKVAALEMTIDEWNESLPPLKEFILPGGNVKSAACHVARTVCRRAERTLVKLHRQVPLANIEMLRYLNRLSDLLFVCARCLAKETDEKEVLWEHPK